MLPRARSGAEMRSPEFQKKLSEGPIWIITARPAGSHGMGKALVLWFLYLLLVALFAGYVAAIALPAGTHYLTVFRLAGTAAFMALSLGLLHDSIWYGRQWRTTVKLMFDGLIYALLLGGTFGWLWPRG